MGIENFISTRFRYISKLYLSYSEGAKEEENLMFRSDFNKHEIYSKFFTKTLYGNTFLVSECIFKLASHCESWR